MKPIASENRTVDSPSFIPLPWHAFAEFARLVWVGCVVTFGPQPKCAADECALCRAACASRLGRRAGGLEKAKRAGRKVASVSQGTVANNDLGKLSAPVIQAFGDREFLNFSAILPYVDVLVAYASYGTVTQAPSFGPMVVAGKGEDKPEVAARVTRTGCGIDVATDNPTPEQGA
jgi:UDP:flavonoid glycosyltransferase YjiC (YdhE family)